MVATETDIIEIPAVPVAEEGVSASAADATADEHHLARHRRTATGIVVSVAMEKTAVISVTRVFLHPKYRKYVRHSKKYMAHD